MKLRSGFVSNSSSCSFLVAFNKLPETVAELEIMLFDDDYVGVYESPKAFAAEVFNEIRGGKGLRSYKEVLAQDKLNDQQIQEVKRFIKENRMTRVFWINVPESASFSLYSYALGKLKHKEFWH